MCWTNIITFVKEKSSNVTWRLVMSHRGLTSWCVVNVFKKPWRDTPYVVTSRLVLTLWSSGSVKLWERRSLGAWEWRSLGAWNRDSPHKLPQHSLIRWFGAVFIRYTLKLPKLGSSMKLATLHGTAWLDLQYRQPKSEEKWLETNNKLKPTFQIAQRATKSCHPIKVWLSESRK